MKEINIIQFLPYFPPHKGGLETHSEEWGKWWVKKGYGNVYNIITDIGQEDLNINNYEKIIFEGEVIGFKKDGCEILVVPSFEVINNFPVYKVWSKKYRLIVKYLKEKGIDYVITRTRFFFTSFIGGLFARKNKIKWIHIEHGSDYVKLNSAIKNFIAKTYDKLIGKWIFKKADKLFGVSDACRVFIQKEFVNREVDVVYRGVELCTSNLQNNSDDNLKEKFPGKIIIGFIGRLFKWKNVESLIKAYYLLDSDLKEKIKIVIVGDGEDYDRLRLMDKDGNIYFTGGKENKKAFYLQSQFDIHFHTSSPGGGLATTLLQAMSLGVFIVSTPYEGADEVIKDGENGILLKDDSINEIKRGLEKALIDFDAKKEDFSNYNKKYFSENFVWEKSIDRYYNLLKDG